MSQLLHLNCFDLLLLIFRLVPRLKSRKFQLHYPELVQDCKPDIVSATAACDEVFEKKASNVINAEFLGEKVP